MNIYLISQTEATGYDTYDSFVTLAETEQEARETYPGNFNIHWKDGAWQLENDQDWESSSWASSPEKVSVTLLGTAVKDRPAGIECSSFNAG